MKFKKILFFVVIILIITNLYKHFYINNQTLSLNKKYDIIKLDKNENYKGKGQEIVYGKNGYFTTFTTVDVNKKIYKEYKQNGSSSWSNNKYWGRNYC